MVAEQRTARSYTDLPQEVKDKISRSTLEVEGLPMRDSHHKIETSQKCHRQSLFAG